MHSENILIVDDDKNIIELLVTILEGEGFHTSEAANGEIALRRLRDESFDLVLLDLMLPGIDGIGIFRRVRQMNDVPIIILTGHKEDEIQLECLQAGADDYVTKPFKSEILLARINAVLNRIPRKNAQRSGNIFNDGYLFIDYLAHCVKTSGKEVMLTPIEFRLLEELSLRPSVVLEYERLLEHVWGPAYTDDKNLLYRHINSLRQKIEPEPAKPKYIIGVPKYGYRFDRR